MTKRWGKHPEELSNLHGAWDLETDYLASAIENLIYAYSPQRIIVGGGVSKHPGLHQALHYKVKQLINGYIQLPLLTNRIDEYILPPALGNRSGGLGAIAMARQFQLNFT